MKSLLVLIVLLGSNVTGQTTNLAQMPHEASPSRTLPLSERFARDVDTNLAAVTLRTCQLSAYVIDPDPNGVNVRSGPGSRYAIVGHLPPASVGAIADLTASQGAWVQLTAAESPERVEFQGTGWVYAPLLGTSTRGYDTKGVKVYARASTQSATVGRIPAATGVKLLGCEQAWAFVESKGVKGWIAPEAQCPDPFTTCP